MNLIERIKKLESAVERLAARTFLLYQKGTYSPTYEGGTTAGTTTYTLQQGSYVRIGRLLVVSGAVVWTAATGTGNAQVSLPFAAASGINFTGAVRLVNVTFTNSTPTPEFSNTQQFFIMRSPLTNAAGAIVAMEAAGNIVFTIVYFVV